MSNDIYPFGTEAIIYCKPPTYNPIPTPLTAKCLPSGLWGDAYCSPASGVGPAILLTGLGICPIISQLFDLFGLLSGCGPFPTTMIGGARAYTNATNPSGRYPKMTVAQLHCNDNEYKSFPTPEISYCQANGKWSDNMCQRVNKKG